MKPKHYPYSGNKKTNKKLEQKTICLDSLKKADPYYSPLLKNERLKREKKDLEKENEDLRRECETLQKILLNERRFFIQEFKHSVIEDYRQTVQINREHEKELQRLKGIS